MPAKEFGEPPAKRDFRAGLLRRPHTVTDSGVGADHDGGGGLAALREQRAGPERVHERNEPRAVEAPQQFEHAAFLSADSELSADKRNPHSLGRSRPGGMGRHGRLTIISS